jgi:hypothetical protein
LYIYVYVAVVFSRSNASASLDYNYKDFKPYFKLSRTQLYLQSRTNGSTNGQHPVRDDFTGKNVDLRVHPHQYDQKVTALVAGTPLDEDGLITSVQLLDNCTGIECKVKKGDQIGGEPAYISASVEMPSILLLQHQPTCHWTTTSEPKTEKGRRRYETWHGDCKQTGKLESGISVVSS